MTLTAPPGPPQPVPRDSASRLIRLRNNLYHDPPETALEWARIYEAEDEEVAKTYIAGHCGHDLRGIYENWISELLEGVRSPIGDRPAQCASLRRRGCTQREIAQVLQLSRTRVRECLKSASRRAPYRSARS